jgi:hypothetical protein
MEIATQAALEIAKQVLSKPKRQARLPIIK